MTHFFDWKIEYFPASVERDSSQQEDYVWEKTVELVFGSEDDFAFAGDFAVLVTIWAITIPGLGDSQQTHDLEEVQKSN